MLLGDLSVTFGDSLTIGVVGWAEFSKTISIEPDLSSIPGAKEAADSFSQIERVAVFQGTQWFIWAHGRVPPRALAKWRGVN